MKTILEYLKRRQKQKYINMEFVRNDKDFHNFNGIHIISDDHDFLLAPQPFSQLSSFREAYEFILHPSGWTLPTVDEMTIISDNLFEINDLLTRNGYSSIKLDSIYWCCDGDNLMYFDFRNKTHNQAKHGNNFIVRLVTHKKH